MNEKKLHLGCGRRKLPGWIGVDVREDVEPDVVADVRHLDYWATAEIDMIYACHVLEHVPRPEILPTLREWHRVMKVGGTLYASVPDFAVLVHLYHERFVPLWRIIGPVCGRQDYPENTHYIVFDYQYLAWLLTEAGFHTVRTYDALDFLPYDHDDYSRAEIDDVGISLNIEATRA